MDTEREMAERHRQQEQEQRVINQKLAARYVARTAVNEGWSLEDMDEVLLALGVHPSLG